MQGYNVAPGDEEPNDWTQSMLQVDELDAMSGVDLHSRIAGKIQVYSLQKRKTT